MTEEIEKTKLLFIGKKTAYDEIIKELECLEEDMRRKREVNENG